MISKIGFENIRVFKDKAEFELKPLTILTGTNNSGKSTIHKMLKLLKNSFKIKGNNIMLDHLEFDSNNSQYDLGNFESNLCRFSDQKNLIFYFGFDDDLHGKLRLQISFSKGLHKTFIENIEIYSESKSILKFDSSNFRELLNKWVKEDENKPNYERFEFDSKMVHVDDRIYQLNNENIDHHLNNLHEYFIEIRNSGVLQDEILSLDNFLENSEDTLNNKQKDLLTILKEKNIVLQSQKAREEIDLNMADDRQDEFYIYAFFVWDENNNKRVKFSEGKRDFAEVFANPYSKDLLFNTELTQLVLGEQDILKKGYKEENIKLLQKLLFESDISTKDEFIKVQKNFEKFMILCAIVKLRNVKNHYHEYDNNGENPLTESIGIIEMFDKYIMTGNRLLDEKMEKYLKDDAIAAYFAEALQNRIIENESLIEIDKMDLDSLAQHERSFSLFEDLSDSIEDLKDRQKYIGKNMLDIYSESIMKSLTSPLVSLKKDLISFVQNIDINLQNPKIQRHYIFTENEEGNPFMNLGNRFVRKMNFEEEIVFINKWIKEFDIGEQLLIEPINAGKEIIGVSFSIIDNFKSKIPLGDNGLGINKVIETLISISTAGHDKVILLEEPESNLHPSLQSKLSDLFVDAYLTFGVRFIIETHSEYLIRKLQYLIAVNDINFESDKVSIYYLHDPRKIPQGQDQVYEMKIRNDGFMDNDFGKGFFDEASTLALGLLNMKNFN